MVVCPSYSIVFVHCLNIKNIKGILNLSIWKVLLDLNLAVSFVFTLCHWGIFSRCGDLFLLKCYKKVTIGLDEQVSPAFINEIYRIW